MAGSTRTTAASRERVDKNTSSMIDLILSKRITSAGGTQAPNIPSFVNLLGVTRYQGKGSKRPASASSRQLGTRDTAKAQPSALHRPNSAAPLSSSFTRFVRSRRGGADVG
jgi:hypothetical protein